MKEVMDKSVPTIITSIFITLLHGISYAKDISFIANSGVSKAIGDGSEFWNLGFSVGGNVFYHVEPNFLLGGCIAYDRWAPNKDEVIRFLSPITVSDVSGVINIIKVAPSFRISVSPFGSQWLLLFGQQDFGLFLMNGKVTIKGSYENAPFEHSTEDSENKYGWSLGGGLIIGKKGNLCLEILALYHIILTEDEGTKYFSVNIGAVFRK
jgi:hypothetical protein